MLDFTINLTRASDALERIATVLERAYPPSVTLEPVTYLLKSKGVIKYGVENDQWNQEQIKESIHQMGMAPEEEASLLQDALSHYREVGGDPEDVELMHILPDQS